MLLYFYFELLFPLPLAMRQAHFRVAKISFYIRDYTFYLSSLQISGLTVSKMTFPQFDNIACDRPAIWRKVQVKRRFPNKLGTRNNSVFCTPVPQSLMCDTSAMGVNVF